MDNVYMIDNLLSGKLSLTEEIVRGMKRVVPAAVVAKSMYTNIDSVDRDLRSVRKDFNRISLVELPKENPESYIDTIRSKDIFHRLSSIAKLLLVLLVLSHQLKLVTVEQKNKYEYKLKEVSDFELSLPYSKSDYLALSKCTCGKTRVMMSDTAEYRCGECGSMEHIDGNLLRKEAMGCNESSARVSRRCNYDYMRHVNYWYDRICGKEDFAPSMDDVRKISSSMERDGIRSHQLTISLMRTYFKEHYLTDKNEHIVKYMIALGYQPPPTFTAQEREKICNRICNIMAGYEELYGKKAKKKYYPYFIVRTIVDIFPSDRQKLMIAKYIHFQTGSTVRNNERIYADTCAYIDGTKSAPIHITIKLANILR